MDVKISVIVPFYKTPIVKLRLCIESFLKQSFSDFELILVDDGNEPEYKKICEEYAESDKRIRIISQKNAGVSAARNNGIKNAQGEYIVFCDSDDYVDGNFLEVLYDNIPGYDMVICGDCEQWYSSNNSSVDMKVFYSTPTQYNWIQYVNFCWNKIFRKAIIDEHNIRFDSGVRLGEDALFVYDYLKYCKHIRCVKEEMYHYVWSEKSAVNTYDARFWQWEERVITCQYEMFNQYPLNKDEHGFMQRWLYVKMKSCLYYYLKHEKDKNIKKDYLKKIMDYKYFNLIFDNYRKNVFYSKADKMILFAWKLLGVNGIKMTQWYSAHRK